MSDVTNLIEAAQSREETWSPRVVAEANGTLVKVARVEGEFVWHDHANEDEVFIVLNGELTIAYEDRDDVVLGVGDIHVVPKGVRHCPKASEECLIALIEPASTAHTGSEVTALTKSLDEQRA